MKVVGILPVPVNLTALLPPLWNSIVEVKLLEEISNGLSGQYIPKQEDIFRSLSIDPNQVKVVIVGQDPYPNPEYAMGLAFSVNKSIIKLPASLRNIYKELEADLDIQRDNGDLSDWVDQGVLLLNRSLTVEPKKAGSHSKIGWQIFTESIISHVATRGALAILWGNEAQELKKHFSDSDYFPSAHPSPLSAYRGFFGSKPFSKVNKRLVEKGVDPIKW